MTSMIMEGRVFPKINGWNLKTVSFGRGEMSNLFKTIMASGEAVLGPPGCSQKILPHFWGSQVCWMFNLDFQFVLGNSASS